MSLSQPTASFADEAALSLPDNAPKVAPPQSPLPADSLERVETWGMNRAALAYVHRPTTIAGIREVFALACQHGVTVGMRGAGRSYGDASLPGENICLDLTRMNRILDWNPATGIVTVEPGVTLRELWRYTIGDGWWPPVVSGTMNVTLGGAAGMNFHGKNNLHVGPLGEHILSFDILLPSGQLETCTPVHNPTLFHAAIGSFGMLGCFTSLTIQMKRIETGLLDVTQCAAPDLAGMLQLFEDSANSADFLVGWIDGFASGEKLGRGLVQSARYVPAARVANPLQSLRTQNQDMPDTLFGIVPKSMLWRVMKPLTNRYGMRLLNALKFRMGSTLGNGKTIRQTHAAFNFLLDYIPDWKFVYKPLGLLQHQSFVPAERVLDCYTRMLQACQEAGIAPFLAVIKKHRHDDFLISYCLDGYSLALDFPITVANRRTLPTLLARLDALVLEAGGRFYLAKDSSLSSAAYAASLGEETRQRFLSIKHECDPDNLLQTDLSRRLFGDFSAE